VKADLAVIGPAIALPRRIPASVTRFYAGEPLYTDATLSSGVSTNGSAVNANVWEVAEEDILILGTHKFGGIAIEGAKGTGTLTAHTVMAACPYANLAQIQGRGETIADWDTDSELLDFIQDVTHIDYAATGGPNSTPKYTIKTAAGTPADTAGFEVVGGIPALSLVNVVVDFRAYRHDVS
jgi:hypothetical protein